MRRQKRNILKMGSWLKAALLATSALAFIMPDAYAHSGSSCTCPAGPDVIKPIARCKNAELDVTCSPTVLSASAINNGSSDNYGGSGIASVTVYPNTFTCADAGYKTVTLTVKDKAGNTSTCCATVHIECYQPTCSITATPGCTITPPPCTCPGPYSSSSTPVTTPLPGTGTSGNPYVITLGWGPQCLTLQGNAYGGNVYYNYCWSASPSNPAPGGLSCYNCQSPVFTPTKAGIYTFTFRTSGFPGSTGVSCTTPSMCVATCTVTICVRDVQYEDDDDDDDVVYESNQDYGHDHGNNSNKKVYVCHVPPGNPSNAHTIYISINAVAAHLRNHSGDRVGKCNEQCGDTKKKKKDKHNNHREARPAGQLISDGELDILLYPNPSSKDFHITLESHAAEPATADILIYDLTGRLVEKHSAQAVGSELTVGQDLASGTYMIQVRHGDQSKMIKVTKQ